MGKEVITKYTITSSFKNNGTFYTDSNGREMIKRTLNSRPDYSYNSSIEPIASNYYPVTSKIVIKDTKAELAILTDRSQGGSSLNDGEIELMVSSCVRRIQSFRIILIKLFSLCFFYIPQFADEFH